MFLVIVVNVKYTFSKDCCDYFIRMGCERSEEWNQGELLRNTTVVQVTADGHLGLRECWWRWRERTGASCWPGGCDREEGGVSVSLGVGVLNIHESRAIIHHSSLSFTGYEPLKVWLLLKSNFFREPFPGTTICSIVVQSLSCVWLSVIPWTAASQPPCPSLSPKISSNSSSMSQWCSPTISSSVFPFSSCLQSFLASGSFPMNIQGWFPLRLTNLISLLWKLLSKVLFRTTIGKLQFFITQPSLWSNSHICTRLLEKP